MMGGCKFEIMDRIIAHLQCKLRADSCTNQEGVDYVVTCLNNEYCKENVYDGHSIDCIGMTFNFIVPSEVSISIGNLINEFLAEVGVGDDARAESLAANYLNYIDEGKGELLNISDKEQLHSLVAKALYMARHGMPDILTTVSFLTTRAI